MPEATHAVDVSSGGAPFSVDTTSDQTGRTTVTVHGEVDLLTAPRLSAALADAQRGASAVLLDLSEVTFLSSAGLSVLVDAQRRADEQHSRFAILATLHAVSRAIEVTGLDAALAVFSDAASAATFLAE